MRDRIIVAVVDTGITYDNLKATVKANLYRNKGEIPDNGIDDDRNGFVDDVTGPSTGPASNHYYQPSTSVHGIGMVSDVSSQIDAAEALTGRPLPVTIMPVSMASGQYYANILKAAQAGASVISLSHNCSYEQKTTISKMLAPYDVIVVTVDRDRPGDVHPDVGEQGMTRYDNVLEVAMISDTIVRGNVHVDLLEVGNSIKNTSESHAIANAAGKVAAIWGLDPSRSPAEVVDILSASTTRSHATVQRNDLRSEMGGQIDLQKAIALADKSHSAPSSPPIAVAEPVRDPQGESNPIERHFIEAIGYTRGTARDDAFHMGSQRASVFGLGGDDDFVIREFASREHIIRDFDEGDSLDISALIDDFRETGRPQDYVRLQECSFNGATHTRVLVAQDDSLYDQAAILSGVDDLSLAAMIASDALIL